MLLSMEIEQKLDMRGKHPLSCAYVGDTWLPAQVTFSIGAADISPITVSPRLKFLGSGHTSRTYKPRAAHFSFVVAGSQVTASLEVLVQRSADSAVITLIIDSISDVLPAAAPQTVAPAAITPCCDVGLEYESAGYDSADESDYPAKAYGDAYEGTYDDFDAWASDSEDEVEAL
jgi:hypothetical protein